MKLPSIFEMLCSALWAFMLALIIACLCTSCTPKCLPELVEVHDTIRTTDSVYIHHTRDSIVYRTAKDSTYEYLRDSVSEKQKGDTILITKWRDHYIYKATAKTDSTAKTEKEVQYKNRYIYSTITKVEHHTKTEKVVPKFYRWCTFAFWLALILGLLCIAWRLYKRYILPV